ncbi:MAG: RNA polymerase sigma factor [Deltaproteobacteria bacterium]|nr:RNA polymerase sigma factor [Deltaproteobacteria bacterium]
MPRDTEVDNLLRQGFRYAFSLTHAQPEAEDLVHDAWVKLLAAGSPRNIPLLFRTIRTLFIDRYRHQTALHLEPLADYHGATRPKDKKRAAFAATREQVDKGLATLRVEEREALFLNAVEGYTAREIAKLVDRPRGTVLSLIHRAKQKMRRYFTDAADEVTP